MLDRTERGWWKKAVFYQIYPKSFQDTDGDGIGDLRGILEHLDYLQTLGVDGIWLSPVYDSPQVDNGYDISDYEGIWPPFGTMEDMELLIREAKKRGISIIMDLVLNHSSDRHPWFLEARKSRDNPYHDWYIWRDGTPDTPPNDMVSAWGDPAWEYVPELGQYYYHQFTREQPDLNWENPEMRHALYRMIRSWADRGVEGFRLDVADNFGKDPDRKITSRGPKLHEYIQEMSREAFCREGLVTVGETWSADAEEAKLYSSPDGRELSMVFQFEHTFADCSGWNKWDLRPLDLVKLKKGLAVWQETLYGCGWNSLFWDNHDLPRIVSRWGDDGKYRKQSAKMLAAVLHGMQGTPYIYQGEELGMVNIRLPIEEYEDVETLNFYRDRMAAGAKEEDVMASVWARSRDNARTVMQWTAGKNAGFTEGTPWFAINPRYREINAEEALADPDSVFCFYQKLIALRKKYDVFTDGRFELLEPESRELFVYTRTCADARMLVAGNFTGESVEWRCPDDFAGGELLLGNWSGPSGDVLRPWEVRMILVRGGAQ